jgi:outer membrane autotransporter protein
MKRKMSGYRSLLLCSLMLILPCTATVAGVYHPKNTATNPTYKGEVPKAKMYKGEAYKGSYVHHTPGYFEVIGAASLSKVRAGNAQLGVTSDETDTLVQTNRNAWRSWGAQLGLGYVYFIGDAQRYFDGAQWFPMIEPELNVYYNNYKNRGDVYRFGNAAFNQLTYNMPIRSTRLMLDAALTVVSYRQLSAYGIAGIGNAWNRVAYRDTTNSGDTCNTQQVSLNNLRKSRFVWELGAGVAYDMSDRVGLSFEYLYTDFGKLRTSGAGNTGLITTPVISPAGFRLRTQALLLGLHVAL